MGRPPKNKIDTRVVFCTKCGHYFKSSIRHPRCWKCKSSTIINATKATKYIKRDATTNELINLQQQMNDLSMKVEESFTYQGGYIQDLYCEVARLNKALQNARIPIPNLSVGISDGKNKR
jgi:hypothetical protein